jgi:hypothetical protein
MTAVPLGEKIQSTSAEKTNAPDFGARESFERDIGSLRI